MTEPPPHPAKYSDTIMSRLASVIAHEAYITKDHKLKVLDPFAGTGRIHTLLDDPNIETWGVEIEKEWAFMHRNTVLGDAHDLPWGVGHFDVVATSPCYGNRMADHHEAKDDSKRMTYRHQLGRALSENSAGKIPWGPRYWEFHELAWDEVTRVLKPGGLFVLNVKNFLRTRTIKGKRVQETVDVAQWHLDAIVTRGYQVEADDQVPVRSMGFGQNGNKRISHERVISFRRV